MREKRLSCFRLNRPAEEAEALGAGIRCEGLSLRDFWFFLDGQAKYLDSRQRQSSGKVCELLVLQMAAV